MAVWGKGGFRYLGYDKRIDKGCIGVRVMPGTRWCGLSRLMEHRLSKQACMGRAIGHIYQVYASIVSKLSIVCMNEQEEKRHFNHTKPLPTFLSLPCL